MTNACMYNVYIYKFGEGASHLTKIFLLALDPERRLK